MSAFFSSHGLTFQVLFFSFSSTLHTKIHTPHHTHRHHVDYHRRERKSRARCHHTHTHDSRSRSLTPSIRLSIRGGERGREGRKERKLRRLAVHLEFFLLPRSLAIPDSSPRPAFCSPRSHMCDLCPHPHNKKTTNHGEEKKKKREKRNERNTTGKKTNKREPQKSRAQGPEKIAAA